jgi:hypothetical protein
MNLFCPSLGQTGSRSFSKYPANHPPRVLLADTLLASYRLGFSLGIAGNQWAGCAGSGPGAAKHLDPFIDLFFDSSLSMKPSIFSAPKADVLPNRNADDRNKLPSALP